MTRDRVKKTVLMMLVAGLPAVASGSALADPLQEGIDLCVAMREKIFECKDAFATAFVARLNAPAEQQSALRKKALEEITADGSGPLEPRQRACAETAKSKGAPPPEKVKEWKAKLEACFVKTDCNERVACMQPVVKPGGGKSVK